jgi:uncharacterized protein (DUF1501 family)
MSRRKKTSSITLERSAARAAGLESIDPALDLGNGLSLATYRAAIADTSAKLSAYNTLLSQVDEAHNAFAAAESGLGETSDRMLAGVASKYGRNSDQYEMAGGTKRSERKRPGKAASAALTSAT